MAIHQAIAAKIHDEKRVHYTKTSSTSFGFSFLTAPPG